MDFLEEAKRLQQAPAVYTGGWVGNFPISYFLRKGDPLYIVCAIVKIDTFYKIVENEEALKHLATQLRWNNPYADRTIDVLGLKPALVYWKGKLIPTPSLPKILIPKLKTCIDPFEENPLPDYEPLFDVEEREWWEVRL
jgi:hypothetical protein